MILKSLKISNLQLIKSIESTFDKVNIVSGLNKDNPNESGNGSGKSTFVLRSILFLLYGYVEEGLTLKDLIRFNEKETIVEGEIEKEGKIYKIIRKIPSELFISVDEVDVQMNTSTLKQKFIDETFGDIHFFRQYRCVDLKNGINVLDLGIVSLRKTLMQFIEDYFVNIRKDLLNQKTERERFSIDKRLYKHYLSEKRLKLLEDKYKYYEESEKEGKIITNEQRQSANNYKSEIQTKERLIYNRKKEMEDMQKSGVCPILKKKCSEITKTMTSEQKQKIDSEIINWENEIIKLREKSKTEQEYLNSLEIAQEDVIEKKQKVYSFITKLKSAFQFKDYKYTKVDIVEYDESIKLLDDFAGIYIKDWLSSLSIIINNLLQAINISVEFTADKDFMKVSDNGETMKYDLLSTGQKLFLNVIFKFAILLQQNKAGLVITDDGLNNIDMPNFIPLIDILKILPFQIIGTYQNYNGEIENVKHFKIIRENGVSKIE
jgi:hypothetical protein